MPWARTALPSAPANQQPDSSIHSIGAEALARTSIFDAIGHSLPQRRRAGGVASKISARIDPDGSIRAANPAPVASEAGSIS